MPPIKRRNSIITRQDQCRTTRRFVTILMLLLAMLFTLRVSMTTLQGDQVSSTLMRGGITTLQQQQHDEDTVILTLQLNEEEQDDETVDVRIRLYATQAPKAAHYIKELANNREETCHKCTLYRGEPVPEYWGSPKYPDRYFDGGRWGPPYALVQGGLLSDTNTLAVPLAESYNPLIQRGMVAWAGGKGGPHFFIALAHHPEWKHEHTVIGEVVKNDMARVDALLKRPLLSTKPKQPPIVSNFVTPISFQIRMQ